MAEPAVITVPLIPAMMVKLMRVAAVNMGQDPKLREALLPKIAEFRRTGDLKLFIFVADDVLGEHWLDIGFEHATPTKYDEAIRGTVEAARKDRHEEVTDGVASDPSDQATPGSSSSRGRDSGDESTGVAQ